MGSFFPLKQILYTMLSNLCHAGSMNMTNSQWNWPNSDTSIALYVGYEGHNTAIPSFTMVR